MILVDTNVLIDFWKNPTEDYRQIFEQQEIATCGVITAEILRGSRSAKEAEKLRRALACFEYLCFEEADWIELAALFAKLKKSGLTVPFQDGMIAYLAVKNNCALWTHDRHFQLIRAAIPLLELT